MEEEKEEEIDYSTYSLEDCCSHTYWKVRVHGYSEAIKLFQELDGEKSIEWSRFTNLISKMVVDPNTLAQEKGLEAALIFVTKSMQVPKIVNNIANGIVQKCFSTPRVKIRELGIQILLMCIEMEKQDTVVEELLKGLVAKNPKVVAGCVTTLRMALHDFGPNTINIKLLEPKLLQILQNRDQTVRCESKLLTIEIFRWLGDTIKINLEPLPPVLLRELVEEFEKIRGEKPVPIKCTITQQNMQNTCTYDCDATNDTNKFKETETIIDASTSNTPTDILSKLPKDFYNQVQEAKWKIRKELLEILEQLLLKHPILEDGNYTDLIIVLKRIIVTDSNVLIVALAIKCLGLLPKGLGRRFHCYAMGCLGVLLNKCKERKNTVQNELRTTMDAIYPIVTLDAILNLIVESLTCKNPYIMTETLMFLKRCIERKETKNVSKNLVKTVTPIIVKIIEGSDIKPRDIASEILSHLMYLAGEKSVTPYMNTLNALRMKYIKDYYQKLKEASDDSNQAAAEKDNTTIVSMEPKITKSKKSFAKTQKLVFNSTESKLSEVSKEVLELNKFENIEPKTKGVDADENCNNETTSDVNTIAVRETAPYTLETVMTKPKRTEVNTTKINTTGYVTNGKTKTGVVTTEVVTTKVITTKVIRTDYVKDQADKIENGDDEVFVDCLTEFPKDYESYLRKKSSSNSASKKHIVDTNAFATTTAEEDSNPQTKSISLQTNKLNLSANAKAILPKDILQNLDTSKPKLSTSHCILESVSSETRIPRLRTPINDTRIRAPISSTSIDSDITNISSDDSIVLKRTDKTKAENYIKQAVNNESDVSITSTPTSVPRRSRTRLPLFKKKKAMYNENESSTTLSNDEDVHEVKRHRMGGGDSRSKSKIPVYTDQKMLLNEEELSTEQITKNAKEIIPIDILNDMSSPNYRSRSLACDRLCEYMPRFNSDIPGVTQTVIRTISEKKPGLKDINLNVMNTKLHTLRKATEMLRPSVTVIGPLIKEVTSKLAEKLNCVAASELLTSFAEATTQEYVVNNVLDYAIEQASTDMLQHSLLWIKQSIVEFGFQLPKYAFIHKLRRLLPHKDNNIKKVTIGLIGVMSQYIDKQILQISFCMEKPVLRKEIELEINKYENKEPPKPIRYSATNYIC